MGQAFPDEQRRNAYHAGEMRSRFVSLLVCTSFLQTSNPFSFSGAIDQHAPSTLRTLHTDPKSSDGLVLLVG